MKKRKSHHKELTHLFSPSCIITVTKSRKIIWEGHAERCGQLGNDKNNSAEILKLRQCLTEVNADETLLQQ